IDGVAARYVGTTASGAVFDESVDALFILLLGLGLIPLWGVWTILPGAMYYLFHAIAFFRPAWRRRLAPSRLRKVIAAAQGILLLSAGSPVAQDYWWFGIGCVGLALVALLFSFGRDVLWLEHAQRQPAPREWRLVTSKLCCVHLIHGCTEHQRNSCQIYCRTTQRTPNGLWRIHHSVLYTPGRHACVYGAGRAWAF